MAEGPDICLVQFNLLLNRPIVPDEPKVRPIKEVRPICSVSFSGIELRENQ